MKNILFCTCVICIGGINDCDAMGFFNKLFKSLTPSYNGSKASEIAFSHMPFTEDVYTKEKSLNQSIYDWSCLSVEARRMDASLRDVRAKKRDCFTIVDSKNASEVDIILFKERIESRVDAVEALRRKEAGEKAVSGDDISLSSFSRIHGGYLGQIKLD